MITAIIFAAHLIFALIVFTKKWQNESLTAAFLNIALIAILFSVGWPITNSIAKFIMKPEGLGIFYNRDAFSLTLLTIVEYFFYRIYYNDVFNADDKEKQ